MEELFTKHVNQIARTVTRIKNCAHPTLKLGR